MAELHEQSDELLTARLKTGDAEAFAAIYRRFVQLLYRYTRRNIADPADCEEIVQEVFESLWARRAEVDITSLQGYLLGATRYKIIHYFRQRAVKARYLEHFRFFESVYDTLEPGESVDPATIQATINQCLEELPERCRVAFRMRLMENLTNSEIATRMNIGKRTVELYISKAYGHLRNSYQKIYRI